MRRTRLWRGLAGFAACLAAMAVAETMAAATPVSALSAAALYAEPRVKPPAPGPAWLSPADYALLKEIEEALARRDWSRAKALAPAADAPIARSLAQWLYFYAEDPLVDIEEADAFLDGHSGWPAARRIQAHVESRIPNSARPEAILAFFDTRDPVTGEGKIHLARALLDEGQREAAVVQLRDAWINHDLPAIVEQSALARYGRHLRTEDHIARVDRLLWSQQVTAARRIFSRLPPHERRLAETRAALLTSARKAAQMYESLREEDRADPGVMLAAVRYFRRAGEEPRAIAIARQAPADPAALRNAARWWDERQLLMRWALKEGLYTEAYDMAAGHGLEPGGPDFAEAEFNAGWIALRFLGAPERAETHFSALAAHVSAPISLARAYYWLARAAEARGANDIAQARYGEAARHAYTYYGQLAAEKLGAATQNFGPVVEPTPEERARFGSRPTVQAMRMLADLQSDHALMVFAYHVDDELESPGEYVELMRLAERRGATHLAVRAGKVGAGRGAFAPEVAYPLVFVPEEATRFAPPEIILGLSRQESEFNPRAYSRAGARGLMQLLPSTAQITARKEGLPYSRSALLDDPVYNMIIGAAHLSHLMEKYDGSWVMTLAAYNAGANRVEEWIERYGDPRAPGVDPVDWVEQIPFSETRNYVQRVFENAQVYRSRLTQSAIAGRLAADLERGGPNGRAGALAALPPNGNLPPIPERTILIANAAALLAPADAAPMTPAPGDKAASSSAATDEPQQPPQTPARKRRVLAEEQTADRAPAPPARKPSQPALSEPAAAFDEASSAAAGVSGAAGPPDGAEASLARLAENEADAASDSQAEGVPPAPLLGVLIEPASPQNAQDAGSCQTYRDYIAETEREEAAADDLNAGMRAELAGDGPAC
ncbi:lytic transglycosylase domain-containing protein [Amphiplicatus metriothermophilus]|uniref:Soluble lytic murein transglycosylase n=1 Tax=Amphiplicatus metriothermophilus TaxID=1519374 RepID=A0A239PP28_9PROT|nr:lytic transglycosylase domain-containing protein [Amphiplicatus metriothermophilus]MBB5518784.1 soluble lytic murein transglycosylase [Amphiplicatus metriothermophilus]SNT72061.1 soluble lytic murein transglycosylase [Amphiplicatus metriothermophilus]